MPATAPRTVALILAGGTGTRTGLDGPKQLASLAGRPVLEHSVATFAEHPGIDLVVIVMPAEHLAAVDAIAARHPGVRDVVAGGATRAESARLGLATVAEHAPGGLVLIHDAARPLVHAETITATLDALRSAAAVAVAVPETETLLEVSTGSGLPIAATVPDRDRLVRCQTPQGFHLDVILRAHEYAGADPDFVPTDDCGVVLRYLPDIEVRIVPGTPDNIKITHAEDFAVAETLLRVREELTRSGGARSDTPRH